MISSAASMDIVNIELEMKQTLSPWMTSLDMFVTETQSSVTAMLIGENKFDFSLNIPKRESRLFLGESSSDHIEVSYENYNTETTIDGYGCNLKMITEGQSCKSTCGNHLNSVV